MFSKFIKWLKDLFKQPAPAPVLPEVPQLKSFQPVMQTTSLFLG